MKIGILTFHNAINYGAVLQAYATQHFLEQQGYDVEVINYRNKAIDNSYLRYTFGWRRMLYRKPWHILDFLITSFWFKRKKKKIEAFNKRYLRQSLKVFHREEPYCMDYDVYLIGSDQVWNPNFTDGFDPFYWGCFYRKPKSKLIAWSVSTKEHTLENKKKELVASYLEQFDAIGVREKQLKVFLESLTNKPIHLTLDPTLLLSKIEWGKFCKPVKENQYVLVYAMQDENMVISKAKLLAEKTKKTLIVINPYSNSIIKRGYKQWLSPVEFLSYFNSADFVVSASFHGTAFSLIFEKQFYCFIKRGSSNVRIESLLKCLNLEDRIVNESESFSLSHTIDYCTVENELLPLIKDTSDFLLGNIK